MKSCTAYYEMNCPVNYDASFDVTDRITPKHPHEGDTYHLAFILAGESQESYEVVLAYTPAESSSWSSNALRDVGELRSGTPSHPEAKYEVWSRDFLFMLSLYRFTRESYLALVEECLELLKPTASEQTPPDAA